MIDKKQIINFLNEISICMELLKENSFRISSYKKASRAIENYNQDIVQLIENKQLTDINGIGQAISQKIYEYYDKGSSEYLENLKAKIPQGIFNILKLKGLGPKKIIHLWEKLGTTSLGELEYACEENRLISLVGFGEKTQNKILNQIQELKKFSGHALLNDAENEILRIKEILKEKYNIKEIEIAGTYRRGVPIVDELVFICKTDETIKDIESNLNIKFVNTNDNDFYYSLFINTGVKEHVENIKLEKGNYKSEAEIFKSAGIEYIPPEIRENNGEIDSARQNNIPELIGIQDIKGVMHAHSTYSDGSDTLENMAVACIEKGYKYLCISDHSKSAFYAGGLNEHDIFEQQAEIKKLNQKYENFHVFSGIEADILKNGSLDYEEKILKSFDLVIASVHSNFTMPKDKMTERIINAVRNPYTTVLGHMSGRLLLGRKGYEIDHDAIIDECIKNNVVIEINANPHRLDIDWKYIKKAKENGAKFAINPDAHSTSGIDHIKYGILTARKGWLEKQHVINCLDKEQIANFFNKKKGI